MFVRQQGEFAPEIWNLGHTLSDYVVCGCQATVANHLRYREPKALAIYH
jgi:hypothetical protein